MYRKESLERNLPLHVDYSEVLENPVPAGRVIPGSVIGDKIGKKVVEPLVFSLTSSWLLLLPSPQQSIDHLPS